MCQRGRHRHFLIYVFLIYAVDVLQCEENVTLSESRRRGKALNISKHPCTGPSGHDGMCTFKWDCIKENGTKIGTCMDGFIVGTCCYYSKDINFSTYDLPDTMNDIDTHEFGTYSKPYKGSSNKYTFPFNYSSTSPDPQLTTKLKPLSTITTFTTPTTTTTTAPPTTPQLVTWSSVSPTKMLLPKRPPLASTFPFAQSSWPMGYTMNHLIHNRPTHHYPMYYTTKHPLKHKLKYGPAKGNFTIFGGVAENSSIAPNTLPHESTTISVPIAQWMSTKTTANIVPIVNVINRLPVQTVYRPGFPTFAVMTPLTTPKPYQHTESVNTSAGNQGAIPQYVKPITTTAQPKKKPQLDYRKDCGVRALAPRARIVGGMSAHFGKWPWQILVKEAAWLGLYHKNKCGGVLISSKYAVTAGHCQPGFLSSLIVLLGEYDLAADLESLKPEMRRVKRMVVHRHYNPQNFDNDIAILELDPPVVFRPHISPICLPERDEDFTGKMAYVTGWGKTVHGGAIPNLLQEVQVPIMSNTKCLDMFKLAGHVKVIKDNFLCAGYETGGKDSCEGDSGGPLMVQRNDSQWVLAGTVSHGIRCADPNLPGVYMRISSYRQWIDKIIGSK